MYLRILAISTLSITFLTFAPVAQASNANKVYRVNDVFDHHKNAPYMGRGYYISAVFGHAPDAVNSTGGKDDVKSTLTSGRDFNHFGAAIGKHLDQFRVELEVTHNKELLTGHQTRTQYRNIKPELVSTPIKIDFKSTNIFLNAYYDMPINEFIIPYLGIGIGATFSETIITNIQNSSNYFKLHRNSDSYQFTAGARLHINEHVSASLAYRGMCTSGKTIFQGGQQILMTSLSYHF